MRTRSLRPNMLIGTSHKQKQALSLRYWFLGKKGVCVFVKCPMLLSCCCCC